MVSDRSDGGDDAVDASERSEARSGYGWRKIVAIGGLSILLLLFVALAALWVARRPIASNILEHEFEQLGVPATYDLERVGLRTQVVRNLVIGDPDDPDLVARYAKIQIRPTWSGGFEVYRVVARGVRLEGRLVNGKVSWGALDKLLPPPSGQPFRLPNIVVDVADASISLRTPNGPLGFAVRGSGNLTGGFEGRVAARTPGLTFGRCRVSDVHALLDVEIVARRPHVEGPISVDRFACPDSQMAIDDFRLAIDSRFSEGFDEFDGSGRISARQVVAGSNGLAALTGMISFEGNPGDARGELELAARRSRLGPIVAERTRLDGRYRIDSEAGTLAFVGDYAVDDANVSGMTAAVTDALAGLAKTPLGPITTAIGRAVQRSARSLDARGEIRIVNGPSGGAARIESADVRTATGGRIQVGGRGITYYWPSGELKIDGQVRTSGGGLPTGVIELHQAGAGAPLQGIARLQPYSVGDSRLALAPLRFTATPSGATQFSTVAELTGSFPDGRVRGLRLPISGRIGPNGALRVGQSCIVARFDSLRFRELQLNGARLPICPVGGAIVSQGPDGSVRVAARIRSPNLSGRLGSSPLLLRADWAQIVGKEFTVNDVAVRLGDPNSPFLMQADRLHGTFRGSGINGTFSDAEATIGNVPLLLSEADAEWRLQGGDLFIDGGVTVSDRADPARFYPLRSEDFHLTLSGNDIRAGGTLRHPPSGTPVTNVTIAHDLGSGAGHAELEVPGLTFGEGLQPEELTRLTEGVVALVEGTVRGQGRINWGGDGQVTSTGTFSTVDMDLAAPFGPVQGLTTTIHFTDLLGLESAPGQVATIDQINPGIAVENGVLRYQILPDQLVKIESGVWPFMGGWLVLEETTLNFGKPTAKRLTFRVIGLNAATFVNNLGFEQIEATGVFDGVLPMIFDENGGRIVGGRLESRPPGGVLAYTGEIGKTGFFAELAFDALKRLRYRNMVIRLDGDLAGEFATRITIDQLALGDTTTAGILRSLTRDLKFKFNITIRGPFRAIIQTIKSLENPIPVISPVLPVPLDSPAIVTEVRRIEEQTDRTQIPPGQPVEVTNPPPPASERR